MKFLSELSSLGQVFWCFLERGSAKYVDISKYPNIPWIWKQHILGAI